MVKSLYECNEIYKLFDNDISGRNISVHKFNNVQFSGDAVYYPNVLFKTSDGTYNPINETVMSLKNVSMNKEYTDVPFDEINSINTDNLFFFVYNTDNYYHFLYDSLPYLLSFFELKKEMDIKLLMNYPNKESNKFYEFVMEFLNIFGIGPQDIVIIDKHTEYKSLYVSDSYTHGDNSNAPPHSKVYELYSRVSNAYTKNVTTSKKLYVSRRTWVHNNRSNIGTDYTNRRLLVNETEVVNYLTTLGFTEIFTELLTTEEKISIFNSAECVIGPIGGGLANVLFSDKNCILIPICSPGFLDINSRFLYSFKNVNVYPYMNTFHTETTPFKKYMRVSYDNIVGEVIDVTENQLTISYTNDIVAGWNNCRKYETLIVNISDCRALDNGLNSQWALDMQDFKTFVENVL